MRREVGGRGALFSTNFFGDFVSIFGIERSLA